MDSYMGASTANRSSSVLNTSTTKVTSSYAGGIDASPTSTFHAEGNANYSARRSAQSSPEGSRLGHVAERFSAFYNDLESEKQSRREAEAARRAQVGEAIVKLERSLEAEIKRRAESDKSLQVMVETELKAMHEKFTMQLRETQMGLKASIDALSRTFAELHNGLREEREQRRADIEHIAQSVVAKVDETQAGLDDERVARLEREAQTLKRVGEDIFRVQEKIDTERVTRETSMTHIQSEIQEVIGGKSVTDEKFQGLVLGEIQALKNAMQLERDERMGEDEQIVHAINDYTRALQDGLRIVNTS